MNIFQALIIIGGVGLLAQTRISQEQIGRLARGEGVVVQTEHGLRTAMPTPGFSYLVHPGDGAGQAHIFSATARRLVLSEVPVRLPDGRYQMQWRPNPAVVAVYLNGLRLSPGQYHLIRTDPHELPDGLLEIPTTNAASAVLIDYEIGAM